MGFFGDIKKAAGLTGTALKEGGSNFVGAAADLDAAVAPAYDYITPGDQSAATQQARDFQHRENGADSNLLDIVSLAKKAGLLKPKKPKPSKRNPKQPTAKHPPARMQGPVQIAPAPGSEYDAAIKSLMQSGPAAPTAAQDKAYSKQSQHVINNAILASRKEYDQAIVNAKLGYARANDEVTKSTAAMDPLMKGARRGFEMNRQAQAADINANAMQSHDAVTTDQSVLDKLGAASLGGTGQQLVSQADDTANAQVAAQQAAASSISNDAAASSSNMASDIAATAMLGGQEAHNNLARDQQLQINNLRAQRAAAIAGAKSTTQGELIAARDKATDKADTASSRNQTLAVQLMGLRQGAVNAQMAADTAKSKTEASLQNDAISNWIAMQGKQNKSVGINPSTGKPVTQYGPAFNKEQSYAGLVAGGIEPGLAMRMTGFDPNPKPVTSFLDLNSLFQKLNG